MGNYIYNMKTLFGLCAIVLAVSALKIDTPPTTTVSGRQAKPAVVSGRQTASATVSGRKTKPATVSGRATAAIVKKPTNSFPKTCSGLKTAMGAWEKRCTTATMNTQCKAEYSMGEALYKKLICKFKVDATKKPAAKPVKAKKLITKIAKRRCPTFKCAPKATNCSFITVSGC